MPRGGSGCVGQWLQETGEDVSGDPWSLHAGKDSAGGWGLPPTRTGVGVCGAETSP